VRIVTGKGTTISGRVLFEGTSARSNDTTPLRVMAQQSDPSRQLIHSLRVIPCRTAFSTTKAIFS